MTTSTISKTQVNETNVYQYLFKCSEDLKSITAFLEKLKIEEALKKIQRQQREQQHADARTDESLRLLTYSNKKRALIDNIDSIICNCSECQKCLNNYRQELSTLLTSEDVHDAISDALVNARKTVKQLTELKEFVKDFLDD